jgi:hypothetical protein
MTPLSHSPIRPRALAAGLALIVVTNAVALGGAAWNRSGEPDSVLDLTERELWLPYNAGFDRDNSGLSVRLQWCAEDSLSVSPLRATARVIANRCVTNHPNWLTQQKLAALGFDVGKPVTTPEGRRHYERILPRRVFLVMELAGPAYERASAAGQPGSRLFIVDGGSSRADLRSAYPDRRRYAIVRGAVSPRVVGTGSAARLAGGISEVSVLQIQVPRQFRPAFDSVQTSRASGQPNTAPVAVSVAFGRRLEPWIISAARR